MNENIMNRNKQFFMFRTKQLLCSSFQLLNKHKNIPEIWDIQKCLVFQEARDDPISMFY